MANIIWATIQYIVRDPLKLLSLLDTPQLWPLVFFSWVRHLLRVQLGGLLLHIFCNTNILLLLCSRQLHQATRPSVFVLMPATTRTIPARIMVTGLSVFSVYWVYMWAENKREGESLTTYTVNSVLSRGILYSLLYTVSDNLSSSVAWSRLTENTVDRD